MKKKQKHEKAKAEILTAMARRGGFSKLQFKSSLLKFTYSSFNVSIIMEMISFFAQFRKKNVV